MKHLASTVKAPADTSIPLPSWYGTAAGAILLLAADPRALGHVGTIDMDAVHRKDGA